MVRKPSTTSGVRTERDGYAAGVALVAAGEPIRLGAEWVCSLSVLGDPEPPARRAFPMGFQAACDCACELAADRPT
jgi:hypothetical protein